MIIDCISDLHGFYPKLDGGDLLIVAGDLTKTDTPDEHMAFMKWLDKQDYKKKVFIAGNHDNFLQKLPANYNILEDCIYLCDSGTTFEGLNIWGSPWTKWFHGVNPKCKAFMLYSEERLADKWALIPPDTDILITHSPARILDIVSRDPIVRGGSAILSGTIKCIKPKLHVFGHIHECGGRIVDKYGGIICVNAAHVNEYYVPTHPAIRVIL